ncbi:MAG: IS30 family transposase [Oleiphilaceae bacterium]
MLKRLGSFYQPYSEQTSFVSIHTAILAERHSRYVMLTKVKNKDSESEGSVLIKQAKKLHTELHKSLTWIKEKG